MAKTRRLYLKVLQYLPLACMALTPSWSYALQKDDSVSFNNDIRPLLVKNCFACHGDAKTLQGNMMLKSFADATGENGYERVIIPFDAANSPLYKRINATHPEMRMPPPEANKILTAKDIDTFKRWIDAGAVYQQHWSYIPPQRPALPKVEQQDWASNPIDLFILQQLEQRGIEPSPAARGKTLVRRLHLDLAGLLPDYSDVQTGQAIDRDSVLYETTVDQLLAADHFGERMAISWLDWVKYSDEISNSGNYISPFYRYRNYVIDSFNNNKPFDQFTIEQLAGDLLPEPTDEQLVASGYNHLVVRIQDGVGFEAIHKYVTERVDKLGQIWLASSFECAQCHDHKFDPILQKDYYQIGSYFSDLDRVGVWSSGVSGDSTEPRNPDSYYKWPQHYMPTATQSQRLEQIDQQLLSLDQQIEQRAEQHDVGELADALLNESEQYDSYFQWVDPTISSADVINAGQSLPLKVEKKRTAGGNGAISGRHINYIFADQLTPEQLGTDYRVSMVLDHDKVSAVQLKLTTSRRWGKPRTLSLDSRNAPVKLKEIELWLKPANGDDAVKVAIASVETTDLSLQATSALIDGDENSIYSVDALDVFDTFRLDRKDDLLLKGIHNEVFLTLYLREPVLNQRGQELQVVLKHTSVDNLARQINVAYTAMPAASPFQHLLEQPLRSNTLMRSVRQTAYNQVEKVFGSEFMDFTVQGIFSWFAVNSGISSPVPFNDVMKSTLATIKERTAWEEIYHDHMMLRHEAFRDLGVKKRDLVREQEKIWGEVDRSWVSRSSNGRWPVRVLLRGEPTDTTGPIAERKLPSFLVANEGEREDGKEQTRLDLAEWVVDAGNPLTARVIVNRYWQMLMGEGLVSTLEDFGSGGAKPTHPELLDWLAVEFIESGWDVKHMVRLIVNSSTYRQSSKQTKALQLEDPLNHLYARQNTRQIEAEFIQDNILKIAGLLQPGMSPKHTIHGAEDHPFYEDQYRRAIYLQRKNTSVPAQLKVFGAKPRVQAVIERPESITPLQALAGLNQPLMFRIANLITDRIMSDNSLADDDARVRYLYQLVLSREPSRDELAISARSKTNFNYGSHADASSDSERSFWLTRVRAVMNVREATIRV